VTIALEVRELGALRTPRDERAVGEAIADEPNAGRRNAYSQAKAGEVLNVKLGAARFVGHVRDPLVIGRDARVALVARTVEQGGDR
jgi:hypothetical protein